jgi:hypothetical protein
MLRVTLPSLVAEFRVIEQEVVSFFAGGFVLFLFSIVCEELVA